MPVADRRDPAELLTHAAWVRRLARRLVGPHDAEDVAQQTLLAAIEQPEPLRSPRAFLAAAARRCALRVRRDAARRRQREVRAARSEASPSTASLLDRVQQERELAQLTAELEEPFRTVVLLRFFEEMEPAAIAARLGLPPATVRTRLHRGLDKLRTRLRRRHGPDWRAGLATMFWPRTGAPAAPLITGALAMSSTTKTAGTLAALVLLAATVWLAVPTADRPSAEPLPASPAAAEAAAEVAPADAEARRVEAAPVATAEAPSTAVTTVRGRVLDSRGQPLPSVPVHLCAFELGGHEIGERLPSPPAVSDALGTFELEVPAGQTAVPVAGEGYCTVRTTPDLRPDEELLLVAAPAVDLTGRVLGGDGTPLAGVRVHVMTMLLAEFPHPLEQTIDPLETPATTGAEGTFALPKTPLAVGVDLLFAKDGYERKRLPSRDAAPGYLEVTLTKDVAAPGQITGTVLDAAGRPVEGAELRLGWEQGARSAADGAFALEFPTRPTTLRAALPGYVPIVRERISVDTPLPLVLQFTQRALAIRGRVVDARGGPVPGVLVNLVDPTPGGRDASLERLSAPPGELPHGALSRCDDEGCFTVAGLADRAYRLRAYDPETLASVRSEPIAAGSTGVVLTLSEDALLHDLAGLVVGRDGRPVPDVTVGTSLLVANRDGVHVLSGPLATTGAGGRFVLRRAPNRDIRLVLTGEDLVGVLVPIEEVLADPEHRLEVLRRCHVQIEGPEGLQVRFEDGTGQRLNLESQTVGRGLMTNAWRIRATKSPVLTLPETAATMIWSKGGEELGRKAIALEPGKNRVTTLTAGN